MKWGDEREVGRQSEEVMAGSAPQCQEPGLRAG